MLEQLERRQRVVLVIRERVVDRRLIAVIAGQVKGVIEIARQPAEDGVIGNRTENEIDRRMLRHIADVGRQQIIDDDDTARLRFEQAAD